MECSPLTDLDKQLIEAARAVLSRNYRPIRHTVGAAVRGGSGRVYTGINIEACAYGPCAEPIALGAAFSNGERIVESIVAVCKRGDDLPVLAPCGNCRQLVVDYVPGAWVILEMRGELVKVRASDLLPSAYVGDFGDE